MFFIKRTKPSNVLGVVLPPAVHYVKSLAERGNIDGLTKSKDDAGQFDAVTCDKVKAYYAAKENTGKLDFEPVDPPEEPTVEKPEVKVSEPKKPEVKSEPKVDKPEPREKAGKPSK